MKKIFPVLSLVLCLNYINGIISAIREVFSHEHLHYHMYRLAALSMQTNLNQIIPLLIISIVAISALMFFLLKVSKKDYFSFLSKYSFSNIINGVAIALVGLHLFINLSIAVDRNSRNDLPNVIFITVDTLRADHISSYGYDRKTPNIDQLSDHSHLFKNAYSQAPCTNPSMWNIMTSKYLVTNDPVKDRIPTIGEYFRSKGYQTGAYIDKSNFMIEKGYSLHQSFDTYDVSDSNFKINPERSAAGLTADVIDWIKKTERPFFTWIYYNDPHDAFDPPDKYKGIYTEGERFNRDLRSDDVFLTSIRKKKKTISKDHVNFLIGAYDEEIRYLDDEIGTLINFLKENGKYDNSIIVFTSDHGEELHDNDKLWNHCMMCSREETWIPLIIKMPGQNNKIEFYDAVQSIDIYPTLVDYFERQDFLDRLMLEGTSMLPLIENDIDVSDEPRWAASFWRHDGAVTIGVNRYWAKKKEEVFLNVITGEPITDEKIKYELRKKLEEIYTKHIEKNTLHYKKMLEQMKSVGYIQ